MLIPHICTWVYLIGSLYYLLLFFSTYRVWFLSSVHLQTSFLTLCGLFFLGLGILFLSFVCDSDSALAHGREL